MPLPTNSQVHVDSLLTNVSVGYQNAEYISDQAFPLVPVRKQSDIIPQVPQSHFFRNEAKLRAPGTKSQGGGFSTDNTSTYFCNRYSYRHEIPDEVRDNADDPYNQDVLAAKLVTDKVQMQREIAFATDFFTTSVWKTDKTGGSDFTVWSNYGGSSPLVDLYTYQDAVEALVGVTPNVFIMGKQVWLQLKWHPDLVDTIKYTQTGQVSLQLFASLAEFQKVLVGKAIYTSTKEGTAETSVTYTRIWGKHGLMLYVPSSPSLMTPAAGYTFVWQRVPSAVQYIKRMRDEESEIDIIEANSYYDQKAVVTSSGLFLSGAVA